MKAVFKGFALLKGGCNKLCKSSGEGEREFYSMPTDLMWKSFKVMSGTAAPCASSRAEPAPRVAVEITDGAQARIVRWIANCRLLDQFLPQHCVHVGA